MKSRCFAHEKSRHGIAFYALYVVLGASAPATAQDLVEGRRQVLTELHRVLLTSGGPKQDGDYGWRGIVLAPPGQSLSPTMVGVDAVGEDRINVGQVLADSALFNRGLVVASGVGNPGAYSLSETWQRVLNESMPRKALSTAALSADAKKWLFKVADRVDRVRGVDFVGEPSAFFLRYREYELLYGILVNASKTQTFGFEVDESWRRHPRLASFKRVDEAMRAVEQDWIRYGHRREVASALGEYDAIAGMKEWSDWTRALASFENERMMVGKTGEVCRTWLSPAPSEWLRMPSWISLSVPNGKEQVIRFQVARVRIERPWLQVGSLLDGRLVLDKAGRRRLIGAGGTPSMMDYPRGRMNVFAEELILVRNVQYRADGGGATHPLTMFANPEQIQLLAYVVRYAG